MATRSTIGIKSQDGTVRAIYCHWDGYPEGVGATLANYYNNETVATALINLGGFSALHDTLEQTQGGVYMDAHYKPQEPARTFTGEQDWFQNFNQGEEYFYLFTGTEWLYSQGGNWSGIKTEQEVTA
jgi:hypothetical protein